MSKIFKEAVAEVKALNDLAMQNAKNVLLESMKPQIEQFINSQLGEAEEDSADKDKIEVPEMEEGMYEAADEEKKDEKDEKEVEESFMMPEAEKPEDEEEEEEEVDEVVEMTEEELQNAVMEVLKASALKTEATVTKGFHDPEDPTPKTAGGKEQKGIADEKSGEHAWNDEVPPHKQDWTVKENNYKKVLKQMTQELNEYKQVCKYLKKHLQEVNLFNSKLLYTNKVLQCSNLNDKQRSIVIEAFDSAKTIRDVELVYRSLSEGLKMAGIVSETRKTSKKARSSSFTTSSSSLLKESIQKEEKQENSFADRMKILAGIVK